jgi:metacaspase-1
MIPSAFRRGMLAATLVGSVALTLAGCHKDDPTAGTDGRARGRVASPAKRALIVGISKYASGTGWHAIHGGNDVPIVRAALVSQGFEDLRSLTNDQANAAGIRAALERLLADSGPGDVVVIHYSGHGHRLTDDDPDEEADGYDEALVPHDAPKKPGPGYDGAKHIRDDEVHDLLQRLRRKVATTDPDTTGNVVLFLDSCFSGTGARGDSVRGDAEPIGPRRAGGRVEAVKARGGGFFTAVTAAETPLAPYVVVTAARANQVDQEMEDPTRRNVMVGPLSWAIGRGLATLQGEPTYRHLFAEIRFHMREQLVPNEPQIEGDADTNIFSGKAVLQEAFIRVKQGTANGREVGLEMGTLGNLLPGAEVEIHRAGSLRRAAGSLLAIGKVVGQPTLTQATVRLDRDVARATLEKGLAFVTRYAFGDLRMRVKVEDLGDAVLRDAILATLRDEVAAAEIVDSNEEVIVELDDVVPSQPAAPATVTVATASGTEVLKSVRRDTPGLADTIANRLLDLARNRYLSRLSFDDPKLRYRLEIIPINVDNCPDPSNLPSCDVEEIPELRALSAGGQMQLPVGTHYKIRVHPGESPAFVVLLDLMPDGQIHNYWPPLEEMDQQQQLRTGRPFDIPIAYRVTKPAGIEKVLLLATQPDALKLWHLETRPLAARGEPRGDELPGLGPFAPLFDDEKVRSRGEIAFRLGGISSHSIEYSVTAVEE